MKSTVIKMVINMIFCIRSEFCSFQFVYDFDLSDVFHSKHLFQKLIFTICIFITPSPNLARKRKKPLTDGSRRSL